MFIVLFHFQLASAIEGDADIAGDTAIYWLVILVEMQKLLWTQALEVGACSQDSEMVGDGHYALARELAGEGGDPGMSSLAHIGNVLSVEEAIVIFAKQKLQFCLLRVQYMIDAPVVIEQG